MSAIPDIPSFLAAHGPAVIAGIAAHYGIDAESCELLREECVPGKEPRTVLLTVLHSSGVYGAAVQVGPDGTPGTMAYMRI